MIVLSSGLLHVGLVGSAASLGRGERRGGRARFGECAAIVRCVFLERSRSRFRIPSEIRCDRTFVEEELDGL